MINGDAILADHISLENLSGSDQDNRNRQHDQNVRYAREKGRIARSSGVELGENPFTGLRARAWKLGWDEASGV